MKDKINSELNTKLEALLGRIDLTEKFLNAHWGNEWKQLQNSSEENHKESDRYRRQAKKKKRSSIQTYYWKKKLLTFKIIIQENFLEMKEDFHDYDLHSQSPHLYLRKHLKCSTPRLFLVKWLDVKGKEKNNPLEL